MHVLVASGGGAHGSYQIGVCQVLAEYGYEPDGFAGISVGSLLAGNCASYRSFKKAMEAYFYVWAEYVLEDKDIYEPWWPSWLGKASLIPSLWKGSFYSSAPLGRLIDKTFFPHSIIDSGKKLAVSAVNIDTGALRTWDETNVTHDALMASAAFPIAFNPIIIDGQRYLDGGLRDVTPLKQAINMGATKITIVMCQREGMGEHHSNSLYDIGMRSVGILLNEVIENDIRSINRVNMGIEMGIIQDKRLIEVELIRPDRGLHASSLSFKQEDWMINYHRGLEDGAKFIASRP